MKIAAIEKWIWVLIYAGLGLVCLGFFMQRASTAIGWAAVAVGAAFTVLGAVFVVLRSRMRGPE